jgi:hypothetical protein
MQQEGHDGIIECVICIISVINKCKKKEINEIRLFTHLLT